MSGPKLAHRGVRLHRRSTLEAGGDIPLWAGEGRARYRVLRKPEAQARLERAGLSRQQAEYRLTRGAREGTLRAVPVHTHVWLFAEDDVEALADQLVAEIAASADADQA